MRIASGGSMNGETQRTFSDSDPYVQTSDTGVVVYVGEMMTNASVDAAGLC